MKLTEVYKKVMPETYQVMYYFSGYITPETIQDIKCSSFGMSYEKIGEDFLTAIRDKLEIENDFTWKDTP
jgi:hypothetical protein